MGNVLILGDGNLSFAKGFHERENEKLTHLIASVFENQTTVTAKDPQSTEYIDYLKQQKNCSVLFNVDATNLGDCTEMTCGNFDHIIFNFPHPGGKTNLRKCKKLLKGVFLSAQKSLSLHGRLHITLAHGQSGLADSESLPSHETLPPSENLLLHDVAMYLPNPQENFSSTEVEWNSECSGSLHSKHIPLSETPPCSNLPAHKADSWQAIYLAAYGGFLLEKTASFEEHFYENYRSSGYRSSARAFHTKKSQILTFRTAKVLNPDTDLNSIPNESGTFVCPLRPFYLHDISAWTIPKNIFPIDVFVSQVRRLSQGLVKQVVYLSGMDYICPKTGKTSLCFRFVWQSYESALPRETANGLQNKLRIALHDSFGIPFEVR